MLAKPQPQSWYLMAVWLSFLKLKASKMLSLPVLAWNLIATSKTRRNHWHHRMGSHLSGARPALKRRRADPKRSQADGLAAVSAPLQFRASTLDKSRRNRFLRRGSLQSCCPWTRGGRRNVLHFLPASSDSPLLAPVGGRRCRTTVPRRVARLSRQHRRTRTVRLPPAANANSSRHWQPGA